MSSARFVIAIAAALFGAAQARASSTQTIAAALLPLPEQLRAGATVVQLDREFRPVVLRKGTNGMVCIADRPDDDRFVLLLVNGMNHVFERAPMDPQLNVATYSDPKLPVVPELTNGIVQFVRRVAERR